MRSRLKFFLLALLAACALLAQETWNGVDRIVAVGDVHGDYDQFTSLLRAAGVIDRENHWTGGKTHLVQVGDVLDRGADSRKALDLLMSLEKESRAAGGNVHALIGNHEAMNMYGDLRYVSPGEFAAFRSKKSEQVREMYFKEQLKQVPETDRAQWEGAHPLGWFEHRSAFAPNGVYGKWIRGHHAVIKVNDMIFMHGGISPKYAKTELKKINQQVSEELEDFSKLQGGMVMDPEGPLWYRGLAQGNEAALGTHVRGVLERLNASYIVVGHTVTQGMVTPRFGGQVLLIDVGLSKVYGSRPACLIVEGGKRYALHRGNKLELPSGSGPELARYMNQVNAIDLAPRP